MCCVVCACGLEDKRSACEHFELKCMLVHSPDERAASIKAHRIDTHSHCNSDIRCATCELVNAVAALLNGNVTKLDDDVADQLAQLGNLAEHQLRLAHFAIVSIIFLLKLSGMVCCCWPVGTCAHSLEHGGSPLVHRVLGRNLQADGDYVQHCMTCLSNSVIWLLCRTKEVEKP